MSKHIPQELNDIIGDEVYFDLKKELEELARSFVDSPAKSYTGQQVHQIIKARLIPQLKRSRSRV